VLAKNAQKIVQRDGVAVQLFVAERNECIAFWARGRRTGQTGAGRDVDHQIMDNWKPLKETAICSSSTLFVRQRPKNGVEYRI
jgi:hypothetical protein